MSDNLIDLHQHLYGCLTPKMLFDFGVAHHKLYAKRLKWYEEEYKKAFNRSIDSSKYWNATDGLSLLRRDYLVQEPCSFSQFQAKFNLAIALLPLQEHFQEVLAIVTSHQAEMGYHYSEYRVPLLDFFTPEQTADFVKDLIADSKRIKQRFAGTFDFKILFSMPAGKLAMNSQHKQLIQLREEVPDFDMVIRGIDFCYFEETDAYYDRLRLIEDSPFECFLHLGETYESYGLLQALTRVADGITKPVNRFAHLNTLGVLPTIDNLFKQPVELEFVRLWIKKNPEWDFTVGLYHRDPLAFAKELRHSILQYMVANNVLVECCPSSNLSLAVRSPADHPIHAFIEHGIDFCISTDDAGIFNTDLKKEYEVCQKTFGLTLKDIEQLKRRSQAIAAGA